MFLLHLSKVMSLKLSYFFLVVVCRSRRTTWHVFLCVCACISKQRTTVALIKEERRTTWLSWSSAIFSFLSLLSKSRHVPPRKFFFFFFFPFASTTTMPPQYLLVKAMTFGINTQGNMADICTCTNPLFFAFPIAAATFSHLGFKWLVASPCRNTSGSVWLLSGVDNPTTRLSLAKFTGTKFEARCMISSIMWLHDYTNENWKSLLPSIITWQLHVTTACRFPRSFLTWSLCTGSKVRARGISGAENNSLKFFLTDLNSVATAPGIFTNWLYHSALQVFSNVFGGATDFLLFNSETYSKIHTVRLKTRDKIQKSALLREKEKEYAWMRLLIACIDFCSLSSLRSEV